MSFPLYFSRIVKLVNPPFFITYSACDSMQMILSQFSPSENTALMYSMSGCAATMRLAGKVHGVVVQMSNDVVGSSTSGNLTMTEGSVSSQYSISASARAVSHLGHQVTTLLDSSSNPLSSAFCIVHQADSMYSFLMV